MSIVWFFD